MIGRTHRKRSARFRCKEMVEVRARSEILATLDADGKLDGLPFQPEMLQYCGGKFRVYRRLEKVFLDSHYYVARMKNTVILEGLRCDGQAHQGCQMGCPLLWKEAWLKPGDYDVAVQRLNHDAAASVECQLPVMQGDRFVCQATELVNATSRLAWWDVRQYFRDLASGAMTPGEVLRTLVLLAYNKSRRMRGRPQYGELFGQQTKPSNVSLNLQPGELVKVKTKEQIAATLDAQGKNRGLGFMGGMAKFCGGRYRVASRVERIIVEWSGEMRKLANTVALENVVCDGLNARGCQRSCYHLWREAWLERVSPPGYADAVSKRGEPGTRPDSCRSLSRSVAPSSGDRANSANGSTPAAPPSNTDVDRRCM